MMDELKMEGVAPNSIHPGVVEDATDIILNL